MIKIKLVGGLADGHETIAENEIVGVQVTFSNLLVMDYIYDRWEDGVYYFVPYPYEMPDCVKNAKFEPLKII